jgi:Flp pilus assembly protein TadG
MFTFKWPSPLRERPSPLREKQSPLRFRQARGGNAAMLFALSAPVLIFAASLAIDFTNYTVVKSKLNEAADAAALAALTPAMLQAPTTTAQAAAYAMFMARANTLTGLVSGDTVATPVVNASGNIRTASVTYTAQYATIFSGILHAPTLNLSGAATAQASIPPNINFYLLLDNSPSMALPASTSGITSMTGYTQTQNGGSGCAFACHQASTNNGDTEGNLCTTGGANPTYSSPTVSSNEYCAATNSNGQALTQLDNYAMARYYNIPLRLDELSAGVTAMMTDANNIQTSGIYATPPVYQFAAYEMDTSWSIGMTYSNGVVNTQLMAMTSNYQSAWTTASANFGVMEMFSNNNVCNSASCTASGGGGDVATEFSNALSTMNTIMTQTPTGNGTNAPGDSPQKVLFIVTDGVEDDTASTCTQAMTGSRCQAPLNPSLCSTIKANGIKIAILYTQYLAVTSNSWYNTWIAPFLSNIPTNLQSCASSPNLFIQASVDDNLSTDLQNLFNAAVQSAALIN